MNLFGQFLAVARFIARHPLTANHRLRAITNFCRWQLGIRILKRKVIVNWVDESKFIVGLGDTGLTGSLYAGFMEFEDMLFLLHALRPSDTFVDVGANIGSYTILASKVVGARTIAFEPLPKTADRLKDQIHVNGIQDLVAVRNIGVGDKEGSLFFTENYDTMNKVSVAGERENTTRVEVSTLDLQVTGGDAYFLKIDVEGFEYNVIEGAHNLLSSDSVAAVIIELNGSGEEFGHDNEEIHRKLAAFHLQPVAYDPLGRSLSKLTGYNRNGGNTIYIKDFEGISALCRSAPKRVVHTANSIEL